MSEKNANSGTTALVPSHAPTQGQETGGVVSKPGFIRRYRLPLFLAFVAVCLYATSILYILYGRGEIL